LIFSRTDLDEFSIKFGPSRPIHSPVIRRLALLLAFKPVIDVRYGLAFTLGAVALVLRAASASRRQLWWGATGIAVAVIPAAALSRSVAVSRLRARLLDNRIIAAGC